MESLEIILHALIEEQIKLPTLATRIRIKYVFLMIPTSDPYLFAFRHNMQHMKRSTVSIRHAMDKLQKAICRGSFGSHQYSVLGGYVGTNMPTTLGMY